MVTLASANLLAINQAERERRIDWLFIKAKRIELGYERPVEREPLVETEIYVAKKE